MINWASPPLARDPGFSSLTSFNIMSHDVLHGENEVKKKRKARLKIAKHLILNNSRPSQFALFILIFTEFLQCL